MRTLKRPGATLVAIALTTVAVPVASVALATPASAAASCTGTSWIYKGDTWFVLPSVNQDDGNINCVMGVGNQSRAVEWLQSTLNVCYRESLVADGKYGSLTAGAVRRAQRSHLINDDGVYGPQTRSVIRWQAYRNGGAFCGVYGA